MLLSGWENWILSNKCHEDLESFIEELAKRTLKWPKHFSNIAALVTLDLHSAKSYLASKEAYNSAKATDLRFIWFQQNWCSCHEITLRWPWVSCLVKECRELESHFNAVFTTEILTDADSTDSSADQTCINPTSQWPRSFMHFWFSTVNRQAADPSCGLWYPFCV